MNDMGAERVAPYLSESFPLRYLSHTEIETLVNLLDQHHRWTESTEQEHDATRPTI